MTMSMPRSGTTYTVGCRMCMQKKAMHKYARQSRTTHRTSPPRMPGDKGLLGQRVSDPEGGAWCPSYAAALTRSQTLFAGAGRCVGYCTGAILP